MTIPQFSNWYYHLMQTCISTLLAILISGPKKIPAVEDGMKCSELTPSDTIMKLDGLQFEKASSAKEGGVKIRRDFTEWNDRVRVALHYLSKKQIK